MFVHCLKSHSKEDVDTVTGLQPHPETWDCVPEKGLDLKSALRLTCLSVSVTMRWDGSETEEPLGASQRGATSLAGINRVLAWFVSQC